MSDTAITDERLAELKAKHGALYRNVLTLPDELDGEKIPIVWKPPGTGIFSIFRQVIESRGSAAGERSLMLAVVVHPEGPEIVRLCEDALSAVRDFLGESGVYRHWGSESQIGERETLSGDALAALSGRLGAAVPDELYSNSLKLPAELGSEEHEIVWRPPTHSERDQFYQTTEKRNGPRANQNLLLRVVVSPERAVLTGLCARAPIAVKDFLDEASVTRFFGVEASVSPTEAL